MPNRVKEKDEHMQEAIDRFDADCKLTDKEWDNLDTDIQEDLALLAEMGEAVCRVSSPPEAEDADTDRAWERMKARMGKHHSQESEIKGTKTKEGKSKAQKLRIAFYSVSVAAVAATLLVFLLISKPKEVHQNFHPVATLSQKANSATNKVNKRQVATGTTTKPSVVANTTSVTCTAMARRNLSNATQLIMELQNQGYDVDGKIQRTSQPAQPGKLGKVVLPDGTEAFLYASSKVTYPSAFVGDTRDVVLEGEAYFKVTHDASHPFIIHTASATTCVLGTELNVRAFKGEPLHVALITGVAEVVGGNDVCRLKPGEGVTMVKGNLLKQQEDMDVYTYALRGYLYADDAPLESVMTTLAHWYGMNVNFIDRKNANRRIHFFMRGSDAPEKAAELLNSMGAFNVTIKGDYFVVN